MGQSAVVGEQTVVWVHSPRHGHREGSRDVVVREEGADVTTGAVTMRTMGTIEQIAAKT